MQITQRNDRLVLMCDQANKLNALGVPAACLDFALSDKQSAWLSQMNTIALSIITSAIWSMVER